VVLVCLFAALWIGCSPATRDKVLRTLFDGLPRSATAAPAPAQQPGAEALPGRVGAIEHEPYAEKQCDACHDPRATNALVMPKRELCFQCHDFQPFQRYVHGPLAAGGCLLCHDPHSSPYRHLLLSASDGFCLSCHARADLRPVDGHQAPRTDCTSCHLAHMSDKKYLLR
jgi:predicted CXXCH cytochrome family protein